MSIEDEFDKDEIAAALKEHENRDEIGEMFEEIKNLDFTDDDSVPDNLIPMDLTAPKTIGEPDFEEIINSEF